MDVKHLRKAIAGLADDLEVYVACEHDTTTGHRVDRAGLEGLRLVIRGEDEYTDIVDWDWNEDNE